MENKETKKAVKANTKKPAKEKNAVDTQTPKTVELSLHNLKIPKGAHQRKRILGRGPSSGHGKTSSRGSKGQTSRAGRDMYLGFEGGQTPLIRRIPKRGFSNPFGQDYQIVNLETIKKIKDAVITPEILEKNGIIKNKNKPVKILGEGELKSAVTIQAHAFSKKAQEKIRSSGGKFEVLSV